LKLTLLIFRVSPARIAQKVPLLAPKMSEREPGRSHNCY